MQAGDGLINLARDYGVSTADLAAANNISATAGLFVGQTLKVPNTKANNSSAASSSSRASSASSSATSAAAVSSKGGNYTVKSGDSLIGLANQNGLSVSQLASANGLSSNAQLRIGQKSPFRRPPPRIK
nr:LysM domain-containing protein [Psychrobacter sp. PraFG1]UNK04660.1 LysM peptidoglycan-binding domain-containing protein [Psychrobacter sp. PraFG1]